MAVLPKPEHQRRRRNVTAATTLLPAEGRAGTAPEWPISRPNAAERRAWEAVWATPQAEAWERLGWVRPVARYVRCMVAAEARGARAALLSEVRQLEDRLGLSPVSMARLRWDIASDELAEVRDTPRVRLVEPVDPAVTAGRGAGEGDSGR